MGFCGAHPRMTLMSDLMKDLMYVRTYLDDLIIITSGSLSEQLSKLDTVLGRLRDAGLKVNATKSFFCTEETDLGYVLTRDTKESTGDSRAKTLHNNVKELRTFLGIFSNIMTCGRT